MKQRIAIHHREGSFSERWIEFCDEHQVDYELVDCYSTDIIERMRNFSALFWHWGHHEPQAKRMARSVIASLEIIGVKVYPSLQTCWHYDDKIAQKYLLEALNVPFVPCYMFYNEKSARNWLKTTKFPLVFKLSSGAASTNVRLVRGLAEAYRLCHTAFRDGFDPVPGYFKDARMKIRRAVKTSSISAKLRQAPHSLRSVMISKKFSNRENGYVYFQEFIPDNKCDIRVTVIGDRAFSYTRDVRPGDFRASGSGLNNYDQSRIPKECLEISYTVADHLEAQSLACDFLITPENRSILTEISYCFPRQHVADSPGHWNRKLEWVEGKMAAEDAILIDMLSGLSIPVTI